MGRSPATAVWQHWDTPWFRQWREHAPCQLTFFWKNLKALKFNLYAWDIVLTTQGEKIFTDKVSTFLYLSWHTNRTLNLWNPAETSMEGFITQTGKSKVVFGGSSWNGHKRPPYWETTVTSLKLIIHSCRCNSKQKARLARQPPEANVIQGLKQSSSWDLEDNQQLQRRHWKSIWRLQLKFNLKEPAYQGMWLHVKQR